MAVTTNLASTVLMAVFLVAVVGVIARFRAHRSGLTTSRDRPRASELPQTAEVAPDRSAPDVGSSETPISWVIGFVLLIVLAGGGAVVFTAGGAPQISSQMAAVLLAVVFGGLLCGYLFSGIYLSLRSHGRKSAEATGVALWLLGLLVVGAIATQLVFLA